MYIYCFEGTSNEETRIHVPIAFPVATTTNVRIKFLRYRIYGYDYNGLRVILLLRMIGIGEWSAEAIK